MYNDIFRRLREERSTIKMDNQHLVSPSPQCPSTAVGFGQEFLNKEQVRTLEYLLTWFLLIFTCSLD